MPALPDTHAGQTAPRGFKAHLCAAAKSLRGSPNAIGPDEWLACDAIVLATGGLSFPRTGSDGTGYALATSVGHTIVAPVPALTPLGAADSLCEAAQGVTLDAKLAVWRRGKRVRVVQGPLGSVMADHTAHAHPCACGWWRGASARRRTALSHWVRTTEPPGVQSRQ